MFAPQYLYVEDMGQLARVGSLHHMNPKDQIQVTRLDSKCLYWLSHLASSFPLLK